MKRLISLLVLVLLAPSCGPATEQYMQLEPRALDVPGAQPILIQVDYGEVTLFESEDGRVGVEGKVLFDEELEYQVESTEGHILIKVFVHGNRSSQTPLQVVVRLPAQRQVKVETDAASVFVQEYQGDVEISSTSGNIMVEQVTGRLTLRSNRGNITVRESSGTVGIVGNYGALTTENVRGEVSVSTIMGNIKFDGPIQGEDTVRLEADHGAISVNLSGDSAVALQVHSASGDVACMLPEMVSSARSCEGKIQSGQGSLSIRTVSGAITLQLLP